MFRDLADRGKLRVGCFIGKMAGRDVTDERDYAVWSITNSGRRPIVVLHVGGELQQKGKNFIILPHAQLPKTLAPGETMTEYSPDIEKLRNAKSLCVWDTLGRIYRAPKQRVESVKVDLEKGTGERGRIPPEEDY